MLTHKFITGTHKVLRSTFALDLFQGEQKVQELFVFETGDTFEFIGESHTPGRYSIEYAGHLYDVSAQQLGIAFSDGLIEFNETIPSVLTNSTEEEVLEYSLMSTSQFPVPPHIPVKSAAS